MARRRGKQARIGPLLRFITRLALAIVILLAGAAILAALGYRNATTKPVVVRYSIAVAGWPASQPPIRIVQLTDTHLSKPDMPVARLEAIVAQVAALHPDMVVLTGDYVGGKIDSLPGYDNLDVGIRPFAALHPRLGVFVVRGNHDDPFWMQVVVPRYGLTYLVNRWADAGPLVVAGLDDFSTGWSRVKAALADIPPGKPVLLLMHNPDAWTPVPPWVTLSLAGHTHGGQILLPLFGAAAIRSVHGDHYRRGLFVEGGRRMIVSSGLGTTAIPIRFGVPPEIVEVTLVPQAAHPPR